ncbi:MAG: hypothetical protein WBA12_03905 [Catalinimonas sp.]
MSLLNLMRPRFPGVVLHVPRLHVGGMALWPLILTRGRRPSARLLNHERIHLRQEWELGVGPFYVWYFAEYAYHRARGLRHDAAYRAISFEREAYAHEADFTYLHRRPLWAFRRYFGKR